MIIKISVRELRGLMASGSAPSVGGALQVASHAGDGKTKEFVWGGAAFRAGSDHDIDRGFRPGDVVRSELETARMVADFNERAFRSGAGIFAKDTTDYGDKVGAYCSRPVYADVPPMPEGYLEGFPHGCPAAAFARGFTEAFRPWLDAFDGVCRETVADRFEDGRALCMEAYAKSGGAAYVRFSVHDGCSADGRRTVLGFCTYVQGWDDVRPLVSREVDGAVRSLAGALQLSDADMSRVRSAVVRSGYGGVVCPNEADDGDGPTTEWERDERARSVARYMERWLGDFEGWFRKVEGGRMSGAGSAGPAGGMTIDAHPSRDGLRVRLMVHKGGGPAVYDEEMALPERDEDLQDWEADFIKALIDKVERTYPWCDVDGFLDGRSGPFDGEVSYRMHAVDNEGE